MEILPLHSLRRSLQTTRADLIGAVRLMDTRNLRRTIEQEIDSYVYQHHPAAVGTAMPQEWVTQQLAAMRAALVEPVAASCRDSGHGRADAR